MLVKMSRKASLKGALSLEYGMLVGLLALVAIGAIMAFGKTQDELFTDIAYKIANAERQAERQVGDLIDGGYWFGGQVNPPIASCWEGSTDADTIGFPQSLVYTCFKGYDGDDNVTGNDQSNDILGGAGDDILKGEGGDDTLSGWHGSDDYYGGDGNDVINGSHGYDRAWGGAGNDLITGNQEAYGEAGDDEIRTGKWESQSFGGDGEDYFVVNSDAWITHQITGGPGADTAEMINEDMMVVSHHQFHDFKNKIDKLILGGKTVSDLNSLPVGVSLGEKDGNLLVRFEGDGTFMELMGIDPAPFGLAQTPGILYGTNEAEHLYSNGSFYDTDGDYFGSASVTEVRLLGGNDVAVTNQNMTLYMGDGDDEIELGKRGVAYGEDGNDVFNIDAFNKPGTADGGAGDDVFTVNYGNRTLVTITTGTGSDVINRRNTAGNSQPNTDTITDFEPGVDVFQLDGVDVDFNSMPGGWSMVDNGLGNVVMSYGAGSTLTFEGTSVAALTS
jgi:Ca2+-binding RTX toxin-like protein/Flp pilus assembly pilin Flp